MIITIYTILNSLTIKIIFNSHNIPNNLITNNQYYTFQKLNEYYNINNTLIMIYTITNTLKQITTLIFSINTPLKILLNDTDNKYIPTNLYRTNTSNTPINNYFLTLILITILIILPTLDINDINNLYK